MYRKLQQNFDVIEFLLRNASPEELNWGKDEAGGSLGQIIYRLRDRERGWVQLCLSCLPPGDIPPAADDDQRGLAADDPVSTCDCVFEAFAQDRRRVVSLLETLTAMPGHETAGIGLVEKIDRHDQVHIQQIEAIVYHMPINPLLARALREIRDYHRKYRSYLVQAASLLDIGTGTGLALRHIIQQNPHLGVVGIDVRDLRLPEVEVPLQLYEGETLPFAAHQFDVSLLFYVLHHCSNPVRLLGEARRVTRHWVIIIEEFDLPDTDKISLDLTERYNHRALGMPTDLPYHLFDQVDFEAMLRQQHLIELERHLLHSETTRPVQKYLYILNCGK